MDRVQFDEPGCTIKGLFSIIIPVLNNAVDIQQCIDSVVKQSELNRELIIVDGGSTDGTVEILEKNKEYAAQIVSAKDNGIYAAFNHGIALSKGEWLFFLGSDDVLWNRDVLLNVNQVLKKKWEGQKVVYGKVVMLDKNGHQVETRGVSWSEYIKKPFGRWSFDHQGIFHHRTLFQEFGLFDEIFQLCGDYDLLLRALKTSEALFLDDLIVAGVSLGGASSLPRNLKKMIQERGKALENNGIHSQSVVSKIVFCKMMVYEMLRNIFGTQFADHMSRVVKSLTVEKIDLG